MKPTMLALVERSTGVLHAAKISPCARCAFSSAATRIVFAA